MRTPFTRLWRKKKHRETPWWTTLSKWRISSSKSKKSTCLLTITSERKWPPKEESPLPVSHDLPPRKGEDQRSKRRIGSAREVETGPDLRKGLRSMNKESPRPHTSNQACINSTWISDLEACSKRMRRATLSLTTLYIRASIGQSYSRTRMSGEGWGRKWKKMQEN